MSTSWTKNIFLYYDDDEARDGTCDHAKKNEARRNLALLFGEEGQAKTTQRLVKDHLVDQVRKEIKEKEIKRK